jgi:hypothetical protein
VKLFIFLLTTTTNLGSHGNNDNRGDGGDERQPGDEGTGGSGRKDKGKGKMMEVQEVAEEHEREEREHKALEQCWEEVMGWVAAALAAENERVRDTQPAIANLTQALSEMEELDTAHPHFARGIAPEPVDTHR